MSLVFFLVLFAAGPFAALALLYFLGDEIAAVRGRFAQRAATTPSNKKAESVPPSRKPLAADEEFCFGT